MGMLERVVHYLRSNGVPFRLFSYPSPEPLPGVVHPVPPGGILVETSVLLVGGQPAIACTPRGTRVNLPGLEAELGVPVIEGSAADLPPPYAGVSGPIPPIGRAIGALTLVDEAVSLASPIVFDAFSSTDIVEVPYDEFSRLERPRVSSFAIGGELPESSEEREPVKRVA
jgi:prolyl-tRNA editing enzyme YbaK/EbsC (Cys-tRNA(Pro) deacylase)